MIVFIISCCITLTMVILKVFVMEKLTHKTREVFSSIDEEYEKELQQKEDELRQLQEVKNMYEEKLIAIKEEEHKANNWWRRILGE